MPNSVHHHFWRLCLMYTALLTPPLAVHAQAAHTDNALVPIAGKWTNQSLSPDLRAAAALAAMTREEKLSLLSTPLALFREKGAPDSTPISAGFIRPIPRIGIPLVSESDASLGVANLNNFRKGDVATALPSALALGSSWDPDIAYRSGAMIGSEARAKGMGIMLAGGVNLVRDPRAGRSFEYISEDPLLSGILGGKVIAGVQSNRIISTAKHYAVNDLETGRNVYNVSMSESVMRESDLLAFQIAIEIGKPGSIMCAYNKVNDVYACENKFLLTDVLRRDWGFDGFVMSDWGAVHSLGSITAGLDQQSGYQTDKEHYFGPVLVKALDTGEMSMDAVDTAAKRILRTLYAHDVIDNPPKTGDAIDYDTNAKIAQEQAEAGIVLLRNEGGILPLAATAKHIVVIGGHADLGVLIGGGSSQVASVGGLALALKQKGEGIRAVIKRTYGGTAPLAALKALFPSAQIDYLDGTDPAAAAALAAKADVAIVFAEKWFSEAWDSPDIALGDGQDELIEKIVSANPKTVVVLETGNAVAMPWRDRVPAILAAWYPGQRGGEAIARILAGAVNPSGHLTVTFPASTAQLPLPKLPSEGVPEPMKGDSNYGVLADRVPFSFSHPEGADVGYRWFTRTGAKPLYPFGHGLSYTNFRYDGLTAKGAKTIKVTFDVTNIGRRPGADVSQVYITPPDRIKRLAGWGKPQLAVGARQNVTVHVDPRLLADFNAQKKRWVIRPGTYRVEVGTSATDTALQTDVRLAGAQFRDKDARSLK